MRWFLLVLLAAVAIGAVTWFDFDDGPARSLVAPEDVDSVADDAGSLDAPAVDAEDDRAALIDEPQAEIAAAPTAIGGRAHIIGRVVHVDGSPAAAVELRLVATTPSVQRGDPDPLRKQETSTDSDGRFDFELDPLAWGRFQMNLDAIGYVATKWQWSSDELTEGTDIGTHVLLVSGSLLVRVVEEGGQSPAGNWQAWANEKLRSADRSLGHNLVMAPLDPSTGSVQLDGLLPGEVIVSVGNGVAGWLPWRDVTIVANETTDVEFVYDGPNLERRIMLRTSMGPHRLVELDRSRVKLIGPGSLVRSLDEIEGDSFDDLPDGLYSARIDDPQFLPWSQDGIELGTRVRIPLTPSATIRLVVRTADNTEPLEEYALEIRVEDTNTRPNTYALLAAGKPVPENGEFALIPRPCTLLVSAEGYGAAEIPLLDLQPNELREVTAQLVRTVKLAGRVVMADGITPVPRAIVHLHLPGAEPTPHRPGFKTVSSRHPVEPIRMLHADGGGYFELQVVPGSYALHGKLNEFIVGRVDPLVVPEQGLDDWVIVRLPELGSLTGRLVGGDTQRVEGLYVDIAEVGGMPNSTFLEEEHLSVVSATGSFRIDNLQPGAHDLYLLGPTFDIEMRPGFRTRTRGARTLIGQVRIESGANTDADFALGDRWPARIDFRARVNGEPAHGYVLQLDSDDGQAGIPSIALDDDGAATLRGLAPGAYRASLRSIEGAWESPIGDHDLAPGQVLELTHDFALFASRVQLIDDESGEPIVNTSVVTERIHGRGVIGKTDAEGWLDLNLPPGGYELSTWQVEPLRTATLTWTAAGPSTERLQMTTPR